MYMMFYIHACIQSGVWGGVELINGKQTFVTANVLPSYIDCSQEGRLPGCLVNTDTDRLDDQCRPGRHGIRSVLVLKLMFAS